MRVHTALIAAAALLLAASLGLAQTGSSSGSSGSNSPPDQIGGKKLKEWIEQLKNPDPSLRLEAVKAVQLFGSDSRDAVKPLVFLLGNDKDVSVRNDVCIALMTVEVRDGDVSSVIKELGERVKDDGQAVVRFQAALAMGRFAEDAKEAIPQLIAASKDHGSFEIRKVAVNSMARAGLDPKTGADPRVTLALIAASADWSADVRLEAVMGLGAMGDPIPMHKPAAIAALKVCIKDRDKAVTVWSQASLLALEKVNDKVNEKEMASLAKHLQDKDSRTKIHTARALSMLGRDAKPYVPDMVNLLKDEDVMVQMGAAFSLGELGKKVDPGNGAMTALSDLLKKKDIDYHLKVAIEEAIKKIQGADAKEVKDKKN